MSSLHTDNGDDVVSAAVSTTPPEDALRLVRTHYALSGAIRRLGSERDENFHILANDGSEFLLKLANASEERAVTEFQTNALLYVARADPGLPVPHLVPDADGQVSQLVTVAGLPPRVMRLYTYVRGEPLHGAPRSSAQCRNLGRVLARLDRALEGYSHPGEGYELRWDLTRAASLRPLLAHIDEPGRRALATRFLDNFEQRALPRLPGLRAQVIHNDFQPSNVLVDATDPTAVCGIIDFGDMVRAPLINDVAVAGAYHVATAPAPLDFVVALTAAYNEVHALLPDEVDLLYDLIATRLVLTAVITNWRVTLHPGNRDYILRNAPAAWCGLERLAGIARDQAGRLMRTACGLE